MAAIGLLVVGVIMVRVERQTPLRGELFDLHKTLGMLVLLLMLFRLAWRATHQPPSLAELRPLFRVAARAVHGLLYALLLLQPLTGYISSAFGAYGIDIFGLDLAPFGHPDPHVRQLMLTAHRLVAWLLTVLILLHVLAAVGHRYSSSGRDIAMRMSLRRLFPRAGSPGSHSGANLEPNGSARNKSAQ